MTNNGYWSPPTLIDCQNSPLETIRTDYFTLLATILTLALSIGAAQESKTGLLDTYKSTHSTNQGGQKAGALDSNHHHQINRGLASNRP